MKDKFFGEKDGEVTQHGLIRFFNQSIDEYVSEDNSWDSASVEMTKTMIFVVVRLFTNLYNKPTLQ